jgi:aspartate aminotransferase
VVVVPGEAFGTKEHVRISYAVSHADVDEGLKRMKDFFAKIA